MKIYDSSMVRLLCALLAVCASASGQSPSFEVASVKPSAVSWLEIRPQRSGGRISWTTDLPYLIGYAYHLDLSRISGPVPGSDYVFEIIATTDATASEDQVRLMFQSLLAERFKMQVHRETTEAEGLAISVSKGGLKIKEAVDGASPPPMPEWMGKETAEASLDGKVVAQAPSAGVVAITGRRVTLAQLAAALERQTGGLVTDATGLKGRYYLGFKFAREDHPDDVDVPPLVTALQELGLRLEKRKGPVETLVVDRIEKAPTGN
jgi:uncharacterized protein (TIGR03435 family)